ncbi:MAG TPA: hypothetical protein DEF43_18425 [Chloroflexus aurantiacus]|uniref:EamA domain-containing protein n=1 Tax=Chloroflexus aurantiacus (strain ATCC 29366 / DSM 635 / J-10-fl) TaxID=324602 RepID=A9WET9_CHLAA|nr:EamA family transporter [Chloroflexus aurantiacus]ABY33848.1 protein of unknown function DUF6 transmembrane [Chloroflexus aurantiacus J-10-fl]RMG51520.1 MAG: hypothetical protein D6716_05690 [Chloroflexota bacterium]HBW69083.1 hypothetical protein [Chloroflexus aurantiacus]
MLLPAVFAALSPIFAEIGVHGIDSDLAVLIRTAVILFVLAGRQMVQPAHAQWQDPGFLILSGLATGTVWVYYFWALKIDEASKVVLIDKLSVVLVTIFTFLSERSSSPNGWISMVQVGVVVLVLQA